MPTKVGMMPHHILREVLLRTGCAAVATIVMHGRLHPAALLADERVIMLELLHSAHEIKGVHELESGAALEAPEIEPKDLEPAERPVSALDGPWRPEEFHDDYRDDLLALLEEEARTGEARARGAERAESTAEVIDMMGVLQKSVGEARARKARGRKRKAS